VLAGSVIAEDLIDGMIPAADSEQPEAPKPARAAVQRKRAVKPAQAAATQPPDAPKKAAQPDPDIDDLLDEPAPAPAEPAPAPADDTDELLDEPPPEPEPEPEPDTVEAVELITAAQLKKLAILLRKQGFDTRETAHGFLFAAVGREIGSSKELTKAEAIKVIDALENAEDK